MRHHIIPLLTLLLLWHPASQLQAQYLTVNIDTLQVRFLLVPAHSTAIGSTLGDTDEEPVHDVSLDSFYIMQYEVTQELWQALMGDDPVAQSWNDEVGCGAQMPAYGVNHFDALRFAEAFAQHSGLDAQLPTEAQWESAARGAKPVGWPTRSEAWYDENSGGHVHPVGSCDAGRNGLYDMAGNVMEWCTDWYGAYPSKPQHNPEGHGTVSFRVCRGGSWATGRKLCLPTDRYAVYPYNRYEYIGLRLVIRLPHRP